MNLAGKLSILLCLWCALPSQAVEDYLEFFADRGLHAVPKPASLPAYANEVAGEWYWMKDTHGNSYVLPIVPNATATKVIAVHRFAEAMGVPHFPIRPILIKRGLNGIPLQHHQERFIQIVGVEPLPPGKWGSSLIYPALELHDPPADEELTVYQLVDMMKFTLTQLALRVKQGRSYWSFGRQLLYEVSIPFADVNDKEEERQLIREYFKDFPYARLRELKEPEAQVFIDSIIPFFDRLESLTEADIEAIFGEHFAQYRLARSALRINYHLRAKKCLAGLRATFQRYLRDRVGGPVARASWERKSGEKPFLNLPAPGFGPTTAEIPSLKEPRNVYSSKLLLEQFYLSRYPYRDVVWGRWQQELGEGDPIAHLLQSASRWDSTVRVVLGDERILGEGFTTPVSIQHHLNRSLPKTLLLYSQSDREGDLIDSIAREIGPAVGLIPLQLTQLRHQALRDSQVEYVIREALGQGARRIVICELHGVTPRQRQAFTDAGITEVITLDHHNGARENWQPWSTVEQLMRMYGYAPNLQQLMIAMRDRSGLSAFPQLGMTKAQLERYLNQASIRSIQSLARKFPYRNGSGRDEVMIVTNYSGSYGTLGTFLSYQAYPAAPNAIVIGERAAGFYGRGPVVLDLAENLTDRFQRRKVYWEGDINGSALIAMTGKDDKDKSRIARRIKKVVLANASGILNDPCIGAVLRGG